MESLPLFVREVRDGLAYMPAKAANAILIFYFNFLNLLVFIK